MASTDTFSDISDAKIKKKLDQTLASYKQLKPGDYVYGTVIAKEPGALIVDVGARSEGIITGRELKSKVIDVESLKIGDKILVYVVTPEAKDGSLVLSIKRTEDIQIWLELEKAQRNNEILEATVVEVNTGGAIVELDSGVRGFIPISQLDPHRIFESGKKMYGKDIGAIVQKKLTELLGEKLKVKIIELSREKGKIIFSEKAVILDEEYSRNKEFIKNIKEGDILEGVVTAITPYGIFVNVGGLEGLVHLSELSWDKVTDVSALYSIGDKVKVMVLEIGEGGRRVAYSIKRLYPDPWKDKIKKYKPGDIVEGVVEGVVDYGAFVRIEEGINGLIHISELSDKLVRDPRDIVKPGQKVKVMILSISETERHLSLSLKRVKAKQAKSSGAQSKSSGAKVGSAKASKTEREKAKAKAEKK